MTSKNYLCKVMKQTPQINKYNFGEKKSAYFILNTSKYHYKIEVENTIGSKLEYILTIYNTKKMNARIIYRNALEQEIKCLFDKSQLKLMFDHLSNFVSYTDEEKKLIKFEMNKALNEVYTAMGWKL